MPPPRAPSAEQSTSSVSVGSTDRTPLSQITSNQTSAGQIAAGIAEFFAQHPEAAVLEDGKVIFDMREARYTLDTGRLDTETQNAGTQNTETRNTETPNAGALETVHARCTLHLWSGERNLVRRIVSFTRRGDTLRLATQRFGQPQSKLLELVPNSQRRTPTTRDTARTRYMPVLERALQRAFVDWRPTGFRTAMDLERSFGPAYARGSLLRGQSAWAVIGVNDQESPAIIDGVLTLGILWLHHCREQAGGRRLYQGLKIVVPRGAAMLTLSRIGWLNHDAAQWELYELDQSTEELTQRDANDHGNLRTRLVHHPDERAAAERFTSAIEQVMRLVPVQEHGRVDARLCNTAELAFLLHGLEFARARIGMAANSFTHTLEITVGAGAHETPLTDANRETLAARVTELFERRRAAVCEPVSRLSNTAASPASAVPAQSPAFEYSSRRRIGPAPQRGKAAAPAHSRMPLRTMPGAAAPQQDALYRAAPERWLESVLRRNLKPLTRSLGPELDAPDGESLSSVRAAQAALDPFALYANEPDPDSIGNRADPPSRSRCASGHASDPLPTEPGRIARLNPDHVYAQVPAIAGASDRGLLDLLGVTADGRLAVLELKADDDLHFALQGLDYWIRVRHHHLQGADAASGLGEFQRHGYFVGVELSPLPPRLYLVAPALHIHPTTDTILRYFSPRVEWNLLALDERWRQHIQVVWRKQGGSAAAV